jgi:aconitate hydratase
MAYMQEETDLLVLAGKEYGTGSSRDWAAKGTSLLGIRAVIAESFERIHRSNLVGMGIMPLVFEEGETMQTLGLDGTERFSLAIPTEIVPKMPMVLRVEGDDGSKKNITLVCRLDSPIEIAYYRNGGILHYVLRSILYAQHIKS